MSPFVEPFILPRDFVGYGMDTPSDPWPNSAKIAVTFVLNVQEGGELSLYNGDATCEPYLSEGITKAAAPLRDLQLETMFEYGSRRGFSRIIEEFEKYGINITANCVARSLEQTPGYGEALVSLGHEISCGGNRWISTATMAPEEEAEHISTAYDKLTELAAAPSGWYLERPSVYTNRLVAREHLKRGTVFKYSSDSYADELPYWVESPLAAEGHEDCGLLMIPTSLDCSDHRFVVPGVGFSQSEDFFYHLKETFDYLYQEGVEGRPKMMTIQLHSRIIGKPGRFAALQKILKYISTQQDVWIATKEEIADHWMKKFPYDGPLDKNARRT